MSNTFDVRLGDCIEEMAKLDAESFDSIVTDPPYGLKFMGKAWDHGVPGAESWIAALRVAKPGAHLIAFGGTRTHHRLMVAIEDAGWELHDTISWLYGSGFPKHRSKLKPGWEPIILARRPAPRATLLNIEGCRLPVVDVDYARNHSGDRGHDGTRGADEIGSTNIRAGGGSASEKGRWPANVILDEEAAALLDSQTGTTTSQGGSPASAGDFGRNGVYGRGSANAELASLGGYGDKGGASRFFYTAKASRSEREEGLEQFLKRPGGSNAKGYTEDVARGLDRNRPVANNHPTVKPLDLMRWLCRLVTSPGGLILDPFCGSGSTGCAALMEGFSTICIDSDPHSVELSRARMLHHGRQLTLDVL